MPKAMPAHCARVRGMFEERPFPFPYFQFLISHSPRSYNPERKGHAWVRHVYYERYRTITPVTH
jgi:hypothetical protein